jgi:DNA helicase II / ATP-dependent DNA helicase PcrA
MTERTFVPTDEQKAAVDFSSNMVVTARPGSGKTAVVAAKIRKLLPSLPNYRGVVAISYTNKASDELEKRSKRGAVDIKRSFFGTIDQFCIGEIIRPFAAHVFEHRVELRTVRLNDVAASLLSKLPHKELSEARVEDTRSFLPFLRACNEDGLIVLEAVGMLSYFIVNQSAACARYIRARYAAVYVDEYQDSGYFQHRLFLSLKEMGLRAVAVGDADQSIFQFAQKDPAHLISLTQPDSGFEQFSLTVNHRSHSSITAYARRLLDPRAAYSADPTGKVYQITVTGDQVAIAHWLRAHIPAAAGKLSVPTLDRIGVLCATSHSANLIAASIGLPHQLHDEGPFGGSPGEEASLFHDLLTYRFDIRRNAQDLMDRHVRGALTSGSERVLRASIFKCRDCANGSIYGTLLDAAEMILQREVSGLAASQLREISSNQDLLRWYLPSTPDQVQILTLHKSKGLEFDIVYHLDLYDWILPRRDIVRGVWTPVFTNVQQCLNLHYVGVTRAVKACILVTSTERINSRGESMAGNPSQFLGRNGVAPRLLMHKPQAD